MPSGDGHKTTINVYRVSFDNESGKQDPASQEDEQLPGRDVCIKTDVVKLIYWSHTAFNEHYNDGHMHADLRPT